jgi:glyoxylase-like metal-dependent hydrolase (beta-lactamase superfamily II)
MPEDIEMKLRIEDNFEDVLGKAADGCGLSGQALADLSGLKLKDVQSLLAGELDLGALRMLAPVLKLDADKLVSMAQSEWYPRSVSLSGLTCYNTPFPVTGYEEMTVNNYLIWDEESKVAIAFDTGANAATMLADLRQNQLTLTALFLTHTHRDHVRAYAEIVTATGCRPYAPKLESYADAAPVAPDESFEIGRFTIQARLTNGHSPGGTTYCIDGLDKKVAIVGDSMVCLSMGKAKQAYANALENNRKYILSLPESTILCPGHGPMTTVGEERLHNPFF